MSPTDCPSDTELAAFHRGSALPEEADRIAAHVEGCARCESVLQTLDRQEESVAAALRQTPGTPTNAWAGAHPTAVPTEQAGLIIAGRYKLVELLGEGGMGAVWMAQQTEPVRRLVAIKLIKAGMDSAGVLARFEQERQALAIMDHQNIAKVLDAGATEQGRPFFVMELVKGVPITRYCDEHQLTPRERLALFIPVCQALQHAHQKGVVHRDVKPSNVLVARYDERAVPKVIDFGIAKATRLALTDKTLITAFGAVVGTPEYMAPEQAELNQLDVDTRADVYALGVLLYELLTGNTPLTRERLQRAALVEILRLVREEEAPRPSTRLSTADGLPSIAAQRATEPRRLTALLRGDLDWIVMKSLEKDRRRRYETASGLARDVERYLADEPVEAGPPSALYRLRKLLRRNRGPALAAGLVLTTLLVGAVVSAWQAVRATRAEIAMADQLQQTRAAEQLAHDREALATKRLGQVQKFNDLLAGVFVDLRPESEVQGGPPMRAQLADRLERVGRNLDGESVGDPLVVAGLQGILGISQRMLGYPDRAAELGRKAYSTISAKLGAGHIQSVNHLEYLALAVRQAGQLTEALPMLEELIRRRRETLGPDSEAELYAVSEYAIALRELGRNSEALPKFRDVLDGRRAKLGSEHPDTLASMNELATTLRTLGRWPEALPLVEEALKGYRAKYGPTGYQTLNCLNSYATGLEAAGRLSEALPLYRELLLARQSRLGPDHPETITALHNLAHALHDSGKPAEALPLYEQAVAGYRTRLGVDHPSTLTAQNNLARVLRDLGRPAEAIQVFTEVLRRRRATIGPDHPQTLVTMGGLGRALEADGKLPEALPLFREAYERTRAEFGPDHPDTSNAMNNLASALSRAGRPDEAIPLLEQALTDRRAKLGPDHPQTLNSLHNLAAGLRSAGRLTDAVPQFEEAVRGYQAKLGPDHAFTLGGMDSLAVTLRDLGRPADAVPLMEEVIRRGRPQGKNLTRFPSFLADMADIYVAAGRLIDAAATHRELIETFHNARANVPVAIARRLAELSELLLRAGKPADAEPLLRECLAAREKALPDAWETADARSMLGETLLGQGKPSEAEPLLLRGYDELKAREATIPVSIKSKLASAVDRLVRVSEAVGKPDDVAKWRAERAKYPAADVLPTDKNKP